MSPRPVYRSPRRSLVGLSLLLAAAFAAATPNSAAAQCVPDPASLCLNAGRFKVQVAWRVPAQGTSGIGTTGSPLTPDTGDFWFFTANNIDLVVKVLDGRAFNNHFWVFFGALSDVNYTITVTDTQTGSVKTYENPSGHIASNADITAF
jgi:hypothetical protein